VRLVLASASPRRAELLRAAGIAFEVLAVDVDERVRAAEVPVDYVRRLASLKSATAAARMTPNLAAAHTVDTIVLGADTTVVVDGEVLGKPADPADAAEMLRRLSGRTHQVMTGVSLRSAARELTHVDVTAVEVAALSLDEVAWYVASGEGRDKAGAYAIQGLAARFIPRIDGSYSNVVGLPVASVWRLLRELGAGTILSVSPFT
jgi:septum formation protein